MSPGKTLTSWNYVAESKKALLSENFLSKHKYTLHQLLNCFISSVLFYQLLETSLTYSKYFIVPFIFILCISTQLFLIEFTSSERLARHLFNFTEAFDDYQTFTLPLKCHEHTVGVWYAFAQKNMAWALSMMLMG